MADEMTSASASRATRSSRDLRLAVLLALLCAAGSVVLRAQEAPPATPTQVPAQVPAGIPAAAPVMSPVEPASSGATEDNEIIDFPDAPDPTQGPAESASHTPPPEAGAPQATTSPAAEPGEEEPPPDAAPRKPGVVGPTPGRFDPTEKVRADFDVSFPVDI